MTSLVGAVVRDFNSNKKLLLALRSRLSALKYDRRYAGSHRTRKLADLRLTTTYEALGRLLNQEVSQ